MAFRCFCNRISRPSRKPSQRFDAALDAHRKFCDYRSHHIQWYLYAPLQLAICCDAIYIYTHIHCLIMVQGEWLWCESKYMLGMNRALKFIVELCWLGRIAKNYVVKERVRNHWMVWAFFGLPAPICYPTRGLYRLQHTSWVKKVAYCG